MSHDGKNKLGDLLKTAVSAGVSAASMGEEVVKGAIESAKAAKSEILTQVKGEFKGWLDKIDLTKEIDKILQNYDLEIQAKVSFKKKNKNESEE